MVALRTKFDGKRIEVPPELLGSAPGDVLVVYIENDLPSATPLVTRRSIWDAVGKAEHSRSAADINAQVRADRDSWEPG
jgi:hypothetical protein